MKPFYFTFGVGDPVNSHHYVVIMAPDSETAAKTMFELYGKKWAFQYRSAHEAGVEAYNLKLRKVHFA